MPQSKLNIERYVDELARTVLAQTKPVAQQESASLDSALKGLAVELWIGAAGGLFIVGDEDDAARLGEARGSVYTAAEVRRVVRIGDPDIVLEIHEWKRTFNGRLRE
jgi:hypothetical protein